MTRMNLQDASCRLTCRLRDGCYHLRAISHSIKDEAEYSHDHTEAASRESTVDSDDLAQESTLILKEGASAVDLYSASCILRVNLALSI